MNNITVLVGIISGVILAVISNWIYDILKDRGLFPSRPSIKHTVIVTTLFLPILFFVALPQLNFQNTSPQTRSSTALTPVNSTPIPTEIVSTPAGYEKSPHDPIRIVIPSIELDNPVFPTGLDQDRLPVVPKREIGWYYLSARPAEGENIVLWGRVFRFRDMPQAPAPFANLDAVQLTDKVYLITSSGVTYSYKVTSKYAVNSDQVEFILPKEKEIVTLVGSVGEVIPAGTSNIDREKKLIVVAEPVTP